MKEIKRENDAAQAIQKTTDDQMPGMETLPEGASTPKEKDLTFRCPKCKKKKLLEITTGLCSKLPIEGFTPDGDVICGDEEVDGCGDHWFECGGCGYVLKDADGSPLGDTDELLQWMKDRGA